MTASHSRLRLIAVAPPIHEASAESVRQKSPQRGHISTLYLWWARRPLPAAWAVLVSALLTERETLRTEARRAGTSTVQTRFDLVAAFRELGERAWSRGVVIDLAVYGGSCLALASNFRISTRDVVAVALRDQAVLDELAAEVGMALSLPASWLNDGVRTYLSPAVDAPAQHALFATYPSETRPGLRVFVPNAAYMLAMKLLALRIDPAAESQDLPDILGLLDVVGLTRKEEIVEFAARFYPEARISGKLHLAIDTIWRERQRRAQNKGHEPPRYLGRRGASC